MLSIEDVVSGAIIFDCSRGATPCRTIKGSSSLSSWKSGMEIMITITPQTTCHCFLKKLNIDVCPAPFLGGGLAPVADVFPVPPDLVPLVTAAPALVFATPVFLPPAEA